MNNVEDIITRVLYPDGREESKETAVISEHVLSVIVNEVPVYRLVCTKSGLKELVAGRLLTEGLINSKDDIYKIYFCKHENEASVFLNTDVKWEESIENIPTCCTGNRVFAFSEKGNVLRKLPGYEWKKEWVFNLAGEFKKGSAIHDKTGGSHVCILARQGKTLYTSEDIGRHNAVDKAVGYALLNDIPLSECMIFTSGRVPVDMVKKVIAAGIPVLVSKSVPTGESVELAKEYGLTLICRAWPDKCEVF